MSESYFSKFPTISYNGTVMADISRRVKLSNNLRRIPTAFYPWQLDHDTRADVLAHQYYDEPTAHWLVHLTNGIVDPYYGWLLTDDQLSQHITDTYGTIEHAQRRISHWATNWVDSDLSIPTAHYDNNLPEQLKKYYVPNYGPGTKILSYRRRPEDWTMETNRVVTISVTDTSRFATGSLIDIHSSWRGNVVGSAEVLVVGTGTLTIKNVIGVWNIGYFVSLGLGDTITNSQVTSVTTVHQAIANEEIPYWSPVSYYDIEVDTNARNGTVLLLDKNYFIEATEQLSKTLGT